MILFYRDTPVTDLPANLRWGHWVRFENGAFFSRFCSMITYIKLSTQNWGNFLTLRPDFRLSNYLSLTLNEWELAGLSSHLPSTLVGVWYWTKCNSNHGPSRVLGKSLECPCHSLQKSPYNKAYNRFFSSDLYIIQLLSTQLTKDFLAPLCF